MANSTFFRRIAFFLGFLVVQSAVAGIYDDILVAANQDDTGQVIDLLKRGMDINTTDNAGNTLLMIAARNNNEKLLDFLLRSRANTLKRNKVGDSAIMLAAYRGHASIVHRLLDTGVKQQQDGWNALHYAAYAGHEEIARMLVTASGTNINAVAPNGQTALILASNAGHLGVAKILIEAKADLDHADYGGKTALTHAKMNDHPDMARLLEIAGATK